MSSYGMTASTSGSVLDRILKEKMYPTVSAGVQEANSNLTSGMSGLSDSVSALQNGDTYADSDEGAGADKVFSAMKDYVSQYNDVVSAAHKSTLTGKVSYTAGMIKSTRANADRLAEIGVTVNRDGTLQLDEKKLKAADISKVKELFSGDDITGYGATVKSRLGFASLDAGPVSRPEKDTATEKDKVEDKKELDSLTYAGAGALKTDIEKLTSDSLYEKKKDKDGVGQYDIDRILDTVKNFAGNYNAMLDAARMSINSGVTSNLARIMDKTAQNSEKLEGFGIHVDSRGKLTLDEDAFKKSDMSRVQSFFKQYGSAIASNVSLVDYYMTTGANASYGYTPFGTYNAQGSFRFDRAI